jgi:hypothetical protein
VCGIQIPVFLFQKRATELDRIGFRCQCGNSVLNFLAGIKRMPRQMSRKSGEVIGYFEYRDFSLLSPSPYYTKQICIGNHLDNQHITVRKFPQVVRMAGLYGMDRGEPSQGLAGPDNAMQVIAGLTVLRVREEGA